ncbi:hypothetical protein Mucpa_5076 [Mucilaginibacter paludis DSM 18603]|uniref:Uncharacterized protein n=1 Tax=Mucilaginibacter paludis DSM 18603 TaxID=714943 RepID=H1YAN4_9SPHI|nr:hypothetical protein Mucpa_5076 [Mucilaginibacter paludis DSM 18603]
MLSRGGGPDGAQWQGGCLAARRTFRNLLIARINTPLRPSREGNRTRASAFKEHCLQEQTNALTIKYLITKFTT